MLETLFDFEYSAFAFRDNWKTIALAVSTLLILYLTLTWIATNVVGQTEIVFVYFSFLILFAVAYGANILKSKIKAIEPIPFGTVSFGYSVKVIALLAVIGLAAGYLLVAQHLTIALPLDVQYKQAVAAMDYTYKVIMSPIIEEMFRAVALIASALVVWRFSKNWWLGLLVGLVISSLGFGIFHWLAYQEEFAFIIAAVVFGFISGLLMLVSKSIWPSVAFHFANNELVFSKGNPTAILIIGGLAMALFVIALLRRWR